MRFISTVEADEAFATLELPQGSSFSATQNAITKIETAAKELKKELKSNNIEVRL